MLGYAKLLMGMWLHSMLGYAKLSIEDFSFEFGVRDSDVTMKGASPSKLA